MRRSQEQNDQDPNGSKTLKDKVGYYLRKLEEERMAQQTLKQEIKHLRRVIAQEIGEDVPIESIIIGTSTWKGRQQQITLLKVFING